MLRRSAAVALGLAVLLAVPSHADDRDVSAQLDEILKELQGIRKALERLPGPPVQRPKQMTVDVDGAPYLGAADSEFAVVEFTDYQCPFCRKFFDSTYQSLVRAYVNR